MKLAEVNLVNMERVGFNLRNFDMIFIWKVGQLQHVLLFKLYPGSRASPS